MKYFYKVTNRKTGRRAFSTVDDRMLNYYRETYDNFDLLYSVEIERVATDEEIEKFWRFSG